MQNKTLLSNYQVILLLFFATVSTSVLFVPGEPVAIVGQDAWLAVVLGTLSAALLVYYPLADLGRHYPGKTIIQYSEKILGKYVGKVYGALLIYFFFQLQVWTTLEFSELAAIFMPETPKTIFAIIISLLIIYAVNCGIETIGRCGEFVFPLGALCLLVIIVTNIMDLNFANLLPVMNSGVSPLFRAAIVPLDWLATGFVFGVLTAFVRERQDLPKVGLSAVGLAGLILTIFSLINIMTLGVPLLERVNFPLLSLAMYGRIAFIERFEAVIVVIWVSWICIRGALYTFATVFSLAQLFKLKDYRFLLIPETVLATAYGLYQYEGFAELAYVFRISHLYYISFTVGLPLLLWIAARVGGKRNI